MRIVQSIAAVVAKMAFHARVFDLGIKKGDLVLDLGSGSSPHFRADVLCDISLSDDRERSGSINIDRPFVVGDAERLPFGDKVFDFVICHHLLEHLRRPDRCLQEIMRVGRRGYIECPSEFAERLGGLPKHRWFVREEGERLIFTQKERPVYSEALAASTQQAWMGEDPAYRLFFWRHPELFFARHRWEEKIEYVIEFAGRVEEGLFVEAQPGAGTEAPGKSLRGYNRYDSKAENILRHFALFVLCAARRKHIVELDNLVACPVCKGGLRRRGEHYRCGSCEREYPVAGGIPVLLAEEGKTAGAEAGDAG